jgi:hypothetical protein
MFDERKWNSDRLTVILHNITEESGKNILKKRALEGPSAQ